ncbi:MAG: hypothetical protein ACLSHG_13395 [Oscillospiraceae bacterium]
MLVETADAAAVAMRITRAEWAALREADIRAAVDHALETRGLAPWTSMKIRTVRCRKGGAAFIAKTHFHPAAPVPVPLVCRPDRGAGLFFRPGSTFGRGVRIDGGWEAVRAHRGRGAAERALRVRRAAAVYRGTVRTHRRTRRRGRPP